MEAHADCVYGLVVIAQAQTSEDNQFEVVLALARISEKFNESNVDGILTTEAVPDDTALLDSIRDF